MTSVPTMQETTTAPSKSPIIVPTTTTTTTTTTNPTPNPTTLETTKSPTPEIVATPVPTTQVMPATSTANCLFMHYNQMVSTVPSTQSQCISVAKDSSSNLMTVTAHFANTAPSTAQLMITSQAQSVNPAEQKSCTDICSTVQAPQTCVCLKGETSKTKTSANAMFFKSGHLNDGLLTRYYTVVNSPQMPEMMDFSMFVGQIMPRTFKPKLSMSLPATKTTNALLDNMGFTGQWRVVQMNLPRKEEDGRLKLTAMPLTFEKGADTQFSVSCLVNDDVGCHVRVNPKFNYNIHVENLGKHTNEIELFALDAPHHSVNGIFDAGYGKHALSMKYLFCGVLVVCIWMVFSVLLCKGLFKTKTKNGTLLDGIKKILGGKKQMHNQKYVMASNSNSNSNSQSYNVLASPVRKTNSVNI